VAIPAAETTGASKSLSVSLSLSMPTPVNAAKGPKAKTRGCRKEGRIWRWAGQGRYRGDDRRRGPSARLSSSRACPMVPHWNDWQRRPRAKEGKVCIMGFFSPLLLACTREFAIAVAAVAVVAFVTARLIAA